jgi:hypothetical protein
MDRLIMLLSTDWFLPYWYSIGFIVEDGRKPCVQEGCREIVKGIIGSAVEYYHVSFSAERLQSTVEHIEKLMKRCQLDRAAVDRVNELIAVDERSDFDTEGLMWILYSLTEKLLATDSNIEDVLLDREIRRAVEQAHSKFGLNQVNFQELSLNSASRWDGYIRTLTPDLPTFLADYASEQLLAGGSFVEIWRYLSDVLTTKQQDELRMWYRKTAHDYMGLDAHLWPAPWGA